MNYMSDAGNRRIAIGVDGGERIDWTHRLVLEPSRRDNSLVDFLFSASTLVR
jgi:hypothetical protein